MDYLNALPVEVWDEIIKNVANILDYMSLPDSQVLSPTQSASVESVRRSQNMLVKLLLTSKTFCALVMPYLYQQAYINSSAVYKGFLESAKSLSGDPNNHRRGYWTKEVHVLENSYFRRYDVPKEVRLDEILLACPNTVVLSVWSVERIEGLDWSNDDWTSNLRSISLCLLQINYEDIRRLSIHFPSLNTLRLEYGDPWIGVSPPEDITFPSLKQLSLSKHFSDHTTLRLLYCPRLQKLYVELDEENTEIWPFLEKHASTLTHFKIYAADDINTGELAFPGEVMDTFHKLKYLSFEPDKMDTLSIQAPHQYLEHLTLFWSQTAVFARLAEHAAIFSSRMFPNLSLVTLAFPSYTLDSNREQIITEVIELFPRAIVQVEMEKY